MENNKKGNAEKGIQYIGSTLNADTYVIQAYTNILEAASKISNSTYAFLYEYCQAITDNDLYPALKTCIVLVADAFDHQHNPNSWITIFSNPPLLTQGLLGNALKQGHLEIHEEPVPAHIVASFPSNRPYIQNTLLFPLLENEKLIALIVLANCTTAYTDTMIQQITPLINTEYQEKKRSLAQKIPPYEGSTQVLQLKNQLEENLQRFQVLTDLAPIGILQLNTTWECIYANKRWLEICGKTSAESKHSRWLDAIHPEDVYDVLSELREKITQGQFFFNKFRLQNNLGQIIWVEVHARPTYSTQGYQNGFIATFSDITDHHRTKEKLKQVTQTDLLTGLVNRQIFIQFLENAIKYAKQDYKLGLFHLNLDAFKSINDALGHIAGDRLLQKVAERLTKCVASEAMVARLGSDEFAVLIQGIVDDKIMATVSDNILKSMVEPIEIYNQEIIITASIGVTYTYNQSESAETLLKKARLALYLAKSNGRNNYQFYSPALFRLPQKRFNLANSLHSALNKDEFALHYQLQGDIKTNQVKGLEALLRWQHPQKGEIKPKEFIPLLENNGLIQEIGRWVFETACYQFASWTEQGLINQDTHISVNVSPHQLRDRSLLPFIRNLLNTTKLVPQGIVLEITESVLFDNFKHTKHLFKQLKDLGIQIAIDDFGTGYSSLTYLKKFPIDFIKIDRSFVRDLLSDPEDTAITKAVIALGNSLNLKVIAEGVDSLKKLNFLHKLGCHWYQGFYLSKPKPASILFKESM